MTIKWKHTDADFTFQELADAIAFLIRTGADWDPLDTEDLTPRKEYPNDPHD